jgi:hypothetical protein
MKQFSREYFLLWKEYLTKKDFNLFLNSKKEWATFLRREVGSYVLTPFETARYLLNEEFREFVLKEKVNSPSQQLSLTLGPTFENMFFSSLLLSNLQSLRIMSQTVLTQVTLLENLKTLIIIGLRFTKFPLIRNVEEVYLLGCPEITEVTGFHNISKLFIRVCENLVDISSLKDIPDLTIRKCANVKNYSAPGNHRSLDLGCYHMRKPPKLSDLSSFIQIIMLNLSGFDLVLSSNFYLPELHSLNISHCTGSYSLDQFGLQKIVDLDISYCNRNMVVKDYLLLKKLKAAKEASSVFSLQIANLPRLEQLLFSNESTAYLPSTLTKLEMVGVKMPFPSMPEKPVASTSPSTSEFKFPELRELVLSDCEKVCLNSNDFTFLRKLIIHGCQQPFDLSYLCNLKELSLSNCYVKNLKNLKKLEKLLLKNCDNVRQSMISELALCNEGHLKVFSSVKCRPFKSFAWNSFPNLEFLELVHPIVGSPNDLLDSTPFGSEDVKDRSDNYHLSELKYFFLSGVSFSATVANNLASRSFSSSENQKSKVLLNKFLDCSFCLEKQLFLDCIYFYSFQSLRNLSNFQFVEIYNCQLLTEIDNLHDIQSLRIVSCPHLQRVFALQNIQKLHVNSCPQLTEILSLRNVEDMETVSCPLLQNIQYLRPLSLPLDQVFEQFIRITGCPRLESLKKPVDQKAIFSVYLSTENILLIFIMFHLHNIEIKSNKDKKFQPLIRSSISILEGKNVV